jgi:hypothetical protein
MHRLLRTISHEIRYPLHGILCNSQALLDTLCEAEHQAAAWGSLSSSECAVTSCGDAVPGSAAAVIASACNGSSASVQPACISSPVRADVTPNLEATAALCGTSFDGKCRPLHDRDILLSVQDCSCHSSDRTYTRTVGNNIVGTGLEHQLLGTKGLRKAAAAKKREACMRDGSGSSSNSSNSNASLTRHSSKLALIKDMITEIHECALHQVSDLHIFKSISATTDLLNRKVVRYAMLAVYNVSCCCVQVLSRAAGALLNIHATYTCLRLLLRLATGKRHQ